MRKHSGHPCLTMKTTQTRVTDPANETKSFMPIEGIVMQQYTVESFTTGERSTVTASDMWKALADQPGPCFTVVRKAGGQYAAVTDGAGAFPVAGEHIASTPEAAAASIRQHYAAITAAA